MNDMILILNFSDEFAVEAAKRLRAEHIYCRIISGMTTASQIKEIAPRGILMAGEVRSGTGVFDAEILRLNIPVLAMGHAAHMLLAAQGGASAGVAISERKAMIQYDKSALFTGLPGGERYVAEALTLMLPPDVRMTASAAGCTIAFENTQARQYGVQFEPERNDPESSMILTNFARDICGCNAWWTIDAAVHEAQTALEEAAERGGYAICAVSGGVDSTLASVLTYKAFGERMTAIFVDTGLMREGEAEWVKRMYGKLGIPLLYVDRSDVVLEALAGKCGMGEKTEVVMHCLHEEIIAQAAAMPDANTLVLGSHYSDYLHSGVRHDDWKRCGLNVIEPLQMLFKREVLDAAEMLGVSQEVFSKKSFPSLGLGARIVGEVTHERLLAMRTAEAIFRDEVRGAGLNRKLHKYFPVFAGSAGFQNGEMVVLRAVTLSGGQLTPARLPYDLVERTVARIMAESPIVARVFYDQTPTMVGKETFA